MRDLHVRVDVEPLSEARVAKVRQQVLARVEADARARPTLHAEEGPRGQRTTVFVSFLSFALAAVVAGLVTRAWIGRMAPENVRFATTESASQFTIGESSLQVAPRSALLVRGDDPHGIDVVLDRGAVTCEVAPRRGRPPFVVDAGEVRVRVVGTRFTVTREGESARVSVEHGAVEVTSRGATTMLHDGESWPAEVESVAALPSLAPSPIPVSPTLPEPAAHPSRARGLRHVVAPSSEPRPAPDQGDMSPSPPPPAAAPPAPAPPTAPAPRDVFESAARMEASSPVRAAELYRGLAAGGSVWAPNALFAVARLAADRGNRGEAKGLLREYLVRYPHGQNAQDARELLGRLR